MRCPICYDKGGNENLYWVDWWTPGPGLDPSMFMLRCHRCDFELYSTDKRILPIDKAILPAKAAEAANLL